MLSRLDAVLQRSKSLERNESYYSASSSSFATGTEEDEMWSGDRKTNIEHHAIKERNHFMVLHPERIYQTLQEVKYSII
jgi:hypothetical protein